MCNEFTMASITGGQIIWETIPILFSSLDIGIQHNKSLFKTQYGNCKRESWQKNIRLLRWNSTVHLSKTPLKRTNYKMCFLYGLVASCIVIANYLSVYINLGTLTGLNVQRIYPPPLVDFGGWWSNYLGNYPTPV